MHRSAKSSWVPLSHDRVMTRMLQESGGIRASSMTPHASSLVTPLILRLSGMSIFVVRYWYCPYCTSTTPSTSCFYCSTSALVTAYSHSSYSEYLLYSRTRDLTNNRFWREVNQGFVTRLNLEVTFSIMQKSMISVIYLEPPDDLIT